MDLNETQRTQSFRGSARDGLYTRRIHNDQRAEIGAVVLFFDFATMPCGSFNILSNQVIKDVIHSDCFDVRTRANNGICCTLLKRPKGYKEALIRIVRCDNTTVDAYVYFSPTGDSIVLVEIEHDFNL